VSERKTVVCELQTKECEEQPPTEHKSITTGQAVCADKTSDSDLFDIEESLDFVEQILPRVSLSSEQKERIRELTEQIRKRYDDPYLNVSLVSDFSSGKSTLINALLGVHLLKTSHEATTAVPTYIQSTQDENPTVTIQTHDGQSFSLENEQEKSQLEQLLGFSLPKDCSEQIALLTTDLAFKTHGISTVREHLQAVFVHVPHCGDTEKIRIIDTPGVNPGTETAQHHVQRTIGILQNTADAAVFLFPAHQAYTDGFQRFLDDNAALLVQDAVYVVSMMDLVED